MVQIICKMNKISWPSYKERFPLMKILKSCHYTVWSANLLNPTQTKSKEDTHKRNLLWFDTPFPFLLCSSLISKQVKTFHIWYPLPFWQTPSSSSPFVFQVFFLLSSLTANPHLVVLSLFYSRAPHEWCMGTCMYRQPVVWRQEHGVLCWPVTLAGVMVSLADGKWPCSVGSSVEMICLLFSCKWAKWLTYYAVEKIFSTKE